MTKFKLVFKQNKDNFKNPKKSENQTSKKGGQTLEKLSFKPPGYEDQGYRHD